MTTPYEDCSRAITLFHRNEQRRKRKNELIKEEAEETAEWNAIQNRLVPVIECSKTPVLQHGSHVVYVVDGTLEIAKPGWAHNLEYVQPDPTTNVLPTLTDAQIDDLAFENAVQDFAAEDEEEIAEILDAAEFLARYRRINPDVRPLVETESDRRNYEEVVGSLNGHPAEDAGGPVS
jgi:hypothetical protein